MMILHLTKLITTLPDMKKFIKTQLNLRKILESLKENKREVEKVSYKCSSPSYTISSTQVSHKTGLVNSKSSKTLHDLGNSDQYTGSFTTIGESNYK